jgi:CheY-like chemotaxis protein
MEAYFVNARDDPVKERGKETTISGILVADYSRDDACLLQYAFNEVGLGDEIKIVRDGGEVINYLNGTAYNGDPRKQKVPDVLLLDTNLPLIDGFDVLRWIKTKPHLKDLPVVILTDRNFVEDINKAWRLGVHSFFVKTARFKDAVQMCVSLRRYRQDLRAGKDANMPESVWPGKEALSIFPLGPTEQPCFPIGA